MQTLAVRDAVQRGGRNGVYLQVTDVAGQQYGCFEPALFPQLTPGATVGAEVAVSRDGKWKNITAVGAVVSTGVGGGAAATGLVDVDATEMADRIKRISALKAATDSIGRFDGQADPLTAGEQVIALATLYLDWLNGDWRPAAFSGK